MIENTEQLLEECREIAKQGINSYWDVEITNNGKDYKVKIGEIISLREHLGDALQEMKRVLLVKAKNDIDEKIVLHERSIKSNYDSINTYTQYIHNLNELKLKFNL